MVTEEELAHLAQFNGSPHLTLSVYLNLDPARQIRRTYQVAYKDLVKLVDTNLGHEARKALEADLERIEDFLKTESPRGRGLAIFSCTSRDLWQVYDLPVPVADEIHTDLTPYLRPLLDVLDEYERYAVALVDKRQARFFSVYLGAIEEANALKDFVPGKHDQGGISQANFQRHHNAHVYRHLKNVVQQLSILERTHPYDRLILAGPEEVTSELRQLLTKPLRAKMIATIPGEIFIGEEDILQRTLEVEHKLEREAEAQLVKDILELEDPTRAARGLQATLNALSMGQVHTLAVADTLRHAGAECPACGCLLADQRSVCPACGAVMTPLQDVVERAIERALEKHLRVDIVHDTAATRLSEAVGGIAALLRFPAD